MNYRSHAKKEIIEALKQGKKVFALDTGNSGEDDVLIGNYDDVLTDVLSHHELAELPIGWALTQLYGLPGELERQLDVEKLMGVDIKVYANYPDDAVYTVIANGRGQEINLQGEKWDDDDDLAGLLYDRLD